MKVVINLDGKIQVLSFPTAKQFTLNEPRGFIRIHGEDLHNVYFNLEYVVCIVPLTMEFSLG